MMGAFFQICRLTFAHESCWNEFFCGHWCREASESSTRDMSNQTGNIHDNFFKKALSDPQQAGTFLREHLPRDVAGLLDHEVPLVRLPTTYIDEKLKGHHSDLLFGVHLKAGGNAGRGPGVVRAGALAGLPEGFKI
jgi:hypothetical protein